MKSRTSAMTGRSGRHFRNADKRRNPGVRGDGWQVRRFNPADPGSGPMAISPVLKGRRMRLLLALAGLITFAADQRGAQSLPAADLTELVELAKETGLARHALAGDKDDRGP